MKKQLLLCLLTITSTTIIAQTQANIKITNPAARAVVHGNFNPNNYLSSNPISNHAAISQGIYSQVNADSLKSYIIQLGKFGNRNSGSDTVSSSRGIGAARRWVFNKFSSFSAANENRLLPSYLQFDQPFCSTNQHRNIMAVLPGTDSSNKEIILIEGHIDSRCVGLCDTTCAAEGIEDNASGTALVMELARVMSRYSYKHTIVFLITIAEEQGLYGAMAMMNYVPKG